MSRSASIMGEVALKAIAAANYENVGTVEFLVDADRKFYFPRSQHALAG